MDQQNQNPQPQVLPQKHFKAFWPIMIIAVLSALVGGLLVWVAYNAGLDEELNALLPGSAKTLVHKDKKALQPMTSEAGNDLTIYTNQDYGFQLTLPKTWQGYVVTPVEMSSNFGSGSLSFWVPTKSEPNFSGMKGFAKILTINVYNQEYWNKLQSEEGPKPGYLGTNSKHQVFGYYPWQDPPSDLVNVNFETNQVAASFKFTK